MGERELAEALQPAQDIFDAAKKVCQSWVGPVPALPPTTRLAYTEASHIVQRRQDEARKLGKVDPKKQKKSAHEAQALPGCQPGVDPDASAFWMVVEVCRGCLTVAGHCLTSTEGHHVPEHSGAVFNDLLHATAHDMSHSN